MKSLKKESLKRQQSVKEKVASLVKRKVKIDTEKGIEVKEDRISLKALALMSSWNKYSNQSIISKIYHKIVNSIRII